MSKAEPEWKVERKTELWQGILPKYCTSMIDWIIVVVILVEKRRTRTGCLDHDIVYQLRESSPCLVAQDNRNNEIAGDNHGYETIAELIERSAMKKHVRYNKQHNRGFNAKQ